MIRGTKSPETMSNFEFQLFEKFILLSIDRRQSVGSLRFWRTGRRYFSVGEVSDRDGTYVLVNPRCTISFVCGLPSA